MSWSTRLPPDQGHASARERHRERNPEPGNLAYVLIWGEIGHSAKIVKITHAYASERNWLVGDQIKAYALRPLSGLFGNLGLRSRAGRAA